MDDIYDTTDISSYDDGRSGAESWTVVDEMKAE
jgi:hypothetical protein